MANEIKYNRLYITDIYNKFKNNVVNVISELSSSDENLKVYSDNSTKYIYANQSSPLTNGELANSTTSKISFNVNSTSYNFYTKHSYTYTENVIGNNFKAFIIAYDYVKGTHGVFENITVLPSLTHQPNGTTNKVNVFSKTSYIVTSPNINGYPDEGTNMSSTTSISLNANNFNELLGNNNYVDCSTYVSYSYIKQNTPRDGEIHNDGKNRLSETELRDFHIWSFTDGYDTTSHLYTENDNAYVNAYAYFNFGTNLNNYFTKNNTNLASVKDYIDTNYVDVVNQQNNNTLFIPNWTVKKSSNKVYITDVKSTTNEKHGQRFKEFYNNAKAYNLPGHVGESFVNVKKYPSWRNNISTCLFYEKIKGDSNGTSGQQSHLGINNYNSAKFIKKISGLPVSIFNDDLKIIFEFDNDYYMPPEGAGAGGTGSNYPNNHWNDEIGINIYINKNRYNSSNPSDISNWDTIGSINVSARIEKYQVGQSTPEGYSFVVRIADGSINYDGAKWADPTDTTHSIEHSVDELYQCLQINTNGEFDIIPRLVTCDGSNINTHVDTSTVPNIYFNTTEDCSGISQIKILITFNKNWNPYHGGDIISPNGGSGSGGSGGGSGSGSGGGGTSTPWASDYVNIYNAYYDYEYFEGGTNNGDDLYNVTVHFEMEPIYPNSVASNPEQTIVVSIGGISTNVGNHDVSDSVTFRPGDTEYKHFNFNFSLTRAASPGEIKDVVIDYSVWVDNFTGSDASHNGSSSSDSFQIMS